MIKIELFNNWMCDNVSPCNWSNRHRYKNYLAKVVLNSDGNEERTYLEISDDCDLFFKVNRLECNDILIASCWDIRKKRQSKHYYIVLDKTENEIILEGERDDVSYTTYRKAYKSLQQRDND